LHFERHLVLAICLSFGAHAWLYLCAHRGERLDQPARLDSVLTLENVYLEPPKPLAPPPQEQPVNDLHPPPLRAARAKEPKPRAARTHELAATPLPAAHPEPVDVEEPTENGAIDLTSETLITGTAHDYAVGVATSRGVGAPSRAAGIAAPAAASGQLGTSDVSSAVGLASQAWSCPWPREADAERIDEQTVVIRVIVDADGNAESATVLSDPGHGFGRAAMRCAMQTRFTPARDPDGKPIRAQSPPIRITFTR
jgi:protein TonB